MQVYHKIICSMWKSKPRHAAPQSNAQTLRQPCLRIILYIFGHLLLLIPTFIFYTCADKQLQKEGKGKYCLYSRLLANFRTIVYGSHMQFETIQHLTSEHRVSIAHSVNTLLTRCHVSLNPRGWGQRSMRQHLVLGFTKQIHKTNSVIIFGRIEEK